MPATFAGMGLFSLPLEATISSVNLLLQHYGTSTALGVTLTACLENLQVEIGVRRCPLEYDYKIWGNLATDSWVKSIWERIWHFGVEIQLDYDPVRLPQEQDFCLMERMVEAGIRGKALVGANRCRKVQQAMFASCLGSANGR